MKAALPTRKLFCSILVRTLNEFAVCHDCVAVLHTRESCNLGCKCASVATSMSWCLRRIRSLVQMKVELDVHAELARCLVALS